MHDIIFSIKNERRSRMKKKIIVITSIVLILIIALTFTGITIHKKHQEKIMEEKAKNAKIIVELKENLDVEFLSEVKVSDFIANINGNITNDYFIDTTKLGEKEVDFEYINDENIKVKYSYKVSIKDTVPPVVWLGSSYTVNIGSNINIPDKVMCGDNYDDNPSCEIVGNYDMNKVGTYPLTFKATDSSGNITEKKFNLNVIKPKPSTGNNNTQSSKTYFSDIVAKHKNRDTEIGVDLSEWQGTVDFEKMKEAGVEFVILRVGGTKGTKGDYFVDGKFVENIEKANAMGMPVGVYFYSYATSKEKALKDAEWIYEQIKPYKIDLGVAFDWENWSFYNNFNLSFYHLTEMANSYLDYFKDKGYEGLLYGSKNYLEQIWLKTDYPIWLAHYAKSTSYQGNYLFWQLCNNGRVDGINADVDINVRYKNKG